MTSVNSLALFSLVIATTFFLASQCMALANESDSDLIEGVKYRNPAERREAGLGTPLGPNAKIFGLLEYETLNISNPDGYKTGHDLKEETYTAQIGLEWHLSSWIKAEAVAETEKDERTQSQLDEAFIEFDLDAFEVTAGRLYAPFGEYYSYFISGPMLEFGETSGNGIIIDVDLSDSIEMQVFGLHNEIPEPISPRRKTQWGLNFSHSNNTETFQIATGYLSDLRASDDGPIREYASEEGISRIDGLNASMLWQIRKTQITLEYVGALARIPTEEGTYRPRAYSGEITFFPTDIFQVSLRYERAFDMSEDIRQQYGIAASFSPLSFLTLTCEYLRGHYPSRLFDMEFDNDEGPEDDDLDPIIMLSTQDEEVDFPPTNTTSSFGLHISIEF